MFVEVDNRSAASLSAEAGSPPSIRHADLLRGTPRGGLAVIRLAPFAYL